MVPQDSGTELNTRQSINTSIALIKLVLQMSRRADESYTLIPFILSRRGGERPVYFLNGIMGRPSLMTSHEGRGLPREITHTHTGLAS